MQVNIGKKLEQLRLEKSFSRKKVCRETKIKLAALRDLENHNALVRDLPSIIIKLSKYYRCSLNEIFGVEQQKTHPLSTALELEQLVRLLISQLR